MPIHSVIIIEKSSESLIYNKYYDMNMLSLSYGPSVFESKLYDQSKYYWNYCNQVKQFCFIDHIYCVMEQCGELLLIICGTDDCDESILARALDTIKQVIIEVLETNTKATITKDYFMNVENYGKFCVSMDDMIVEGVIESFDTDMIAKYSKLKSG